MSGRAGKLQAAVDGLVHVIMELREADKGDDTGLALGDLIRRERDAWGLSLQALADRAGNSKAHIWDMERSASINPTARQLAALGDALRLPPIQLLNAALTSQRIAAASAASAAPVNADAVPGKTPSPPPHKAERRAL